MVDLQICTNVAIRFLYFRMLERKRPAQNHSYQLWCPHKERGAGRVYNL